MTLKERYLKAVAAQLSGKTRDDIIAELDDAILTRMEAREAELGRPLTEADEEAVLRETGHPLTVAAQYGSGPHHVVGPELYPWWMFGVKVGLSLMVVITGIGVAVRILSGNADIGQAIGQAFADMFSGGITIIGLATVAGFIIERQAERPAFLKDWRVKDLAFFEMAALNPLEWLGWRPEDSGSGVNVPNPGSHGETRHWTMSPMAAAIASAAGWSVLVLWWAGLLNMGGLGLEHLTDVNGVDYGGLLAQIWRLTYWPVVIYGVTRVLFDLSRAFRPVGPRATGLVDMAFAIARLVFFGWLWAFSPLTPLINAPTFEVFKERAQMVFQNGDRVLADILMIFVVICIVQTIWQVLEAAWRAATGRWGRHCGLRIAAPQ